MTKYLFNDKVYTNWDTMVTAVMEAFPNCHKDNYPDIIDENVEEVVGALYTCGYCGALTTNGIYCNVLHRSLARQEEEEQVDRDREDWETWGDYKQDSWKGN